MGTLSLAKSVCVFLLLGLSFAPARIHAASRPYATGQTGVPRFEPADCPFKIPADRIIQCGYLVVPEDRSQPGGRVIRLGVAIVKSASPHPAPDPILHLNGGPGGRAVQDLPPFFDLFKFLASDPNRDVIFFDQRGVGWSQPALDCPELGPSLVRQAKGGLLSPDEEQVPYRACRDRWLSQRVNLAAYNTRESAADVNDLWRTLGYSQVNLYSISYGTLLAQTVMRDYPEGIRSVVLDSAYPLQISLFGDMASNLSDSFKHLFANCASDPICRAVYPDLEAVFYQQLDRLAAHRTPVTLVGTDPRTQERFSFTLDGAEFVNQVKSAQSRQVPGLIYDVRDGIYTEIIENRELALETLYRYSAPFSRAMAYSVICSQSMYFATPDQLASAAVYPESVYADRFIQHEIGPLPCDEWPARPRDPMDKLPLVSDIPTLVLIGEYDSTLTPAYGQIFAKNLQRSFIIHVPNAGHGVSIGAGPCVSTLMMDFIRDPTRRPNDACVASYGRPVLDTAFVIRAAAMRLPIQGLIVLVSLIAAWQFVTLGAGFIRSGARAFSWRHSLRLVGARLAAVSAAAILIAWAGSQAGWLPLKPGSLIALILPVLAAMPAAFLFSPEDEPILEVTLACPRLLSWTLLERLGLLLALEGSVGLSASLLTFQATGETLALTILRWLPPLLLLVGLAVCLTLLTRRAVFSISVTCLLWFAVSAFGDALVTRWPWLWFVHFYLQPDHPFFVLNRWLVAVTGMSLMAWTASRLLRDEERLLLASRKVNKVLRQARTGRAAKGQALDPLVSSPDSLPKEIMCPWLSGLRQLAAMIHFEFLLQWRRRGMTSVIVGLVATPLFVAALTRSQLAASGAASLEPESSTFQMALAQMQFGAWMGSALVLTLLLPILVADTVPRDRQWGIRELLNSLPITSSTYLGGKLLSLWASLLVGLGAAGVVTALVWRLVIGPYDLSIFLRLWLVGVVPLALINSGLSMLLAAGQPTTRRAILIGVAFVLVCIVGQAVGLSLFADRVVLSVRENVQPGYSVGDLLWSAMDPGRIALSLYFVIVQPGNALGVPSNLVQAVRNTVSFDKVWLSIGGGAVQLALIWLVVLWWMRCQDRET